MEGVGLQELSVLGCGEFVFACLSSEDFEIEQGFFFFVRFSKFKSGKGLVRSKDFQNSPRSSASWADANGETESCFRFGALGRYIAGAFGRGAKNPGSWGLVDRKKLSFRSRKPTFPGVLIAALSA